MAQWVVDLKNKNATLGNVRVSFHRARDDSASIGAWVDTETATSPVVDKDKLEAAIQAIAEAIKERGWPD